MPQLDNQRQNDLPWFDLSTGSVEIVLRRSVRALLNQPARRNEVISTQPNPPAIHIAELEAALHIGEAFIRGFLNLDVGIG